MITNTAVALAFTSISLLFLALPVHGQEQNDTCADSQFGCFEVTIPDTPINTNTSIDTFASNTGQGLSGYVGFIANIITALVVGTGLVMVVAGGIVYMTAGGSGARIGLAKTIIGGALGGILLALTGWLILNTISPQFASNVQEPELNPAGAVPLNPGQGGNPRQ